MPSGCPKLLGRVRCARMNGSREFIETQPLRPPLLPLVRGSVRYKASGDERVSASVHGDLARNADPSFLSPERKKKRKPTSHLLDVDILIPSCMKRGARRRRRTGVSANSFYLAEEEIRSGREIRKGTARRGGGWRMEESVSARIIFHREAAE